MNDVNTLHNSLLVGAVLFALGVTGFLTRRNLIILFISTEMMLLGTANNFLAWGRFHGNLQGQVMAIFILTIAACEAALAMAFFMVLYHRRRALDVALWNTLREVEAPLPLTTDDGAEPPTQIEYPKLNPAGVEPNLADKKVVEHV